MKSQQMTRLQWAIVLPSLCLLGLAVFTGCKKGSGLPTVDVTGTVLLDGEPVEGATVLFKPTAEGGRGASGVTNAEGVYKLTTAEKDDGALPGSYQVAITKRLVDDDGLPDEVDPDSEESLDNLYNKLDPSKDQESKNSIAEMYANPAGSGLTATVKESGENKFDFEVKSK